MIHLTDLICLVMWGEMVTSGILMILVTMGIRARKMTTPRILLRWRTNYQKESSRVATMRL